MDKDILYPLRLLHGRLHDARVDTQNKCDYYRYLRTPKGRKCYVFGTPLHSNIGDSAIVLAEHAFLKSYLGYEPIKEIAAYEYTEYKDTILRALGKHDVICLHGGGNMGDTWYPEETMRREIVTEFGDRPMIVFPQTIHYSDTALGKARASESVQYYNKQGNPTLIAREKVSYQIMKELYPQAEIMLIPDIVLSATMETFGVERQRREGIMLCMRNDAERALAEEDYDRIQHMIQPLCMPVRRTDMHTDRQVTKENRAECVKEKMTEFARARLVITDRLHGMVFAAITGTPCVVFSNYNHKVRGTYEWIKYLPYIRYVESVEEMEACMPELLAMENCEFDNTPLKPYYEKLAEVVKQKCR